MARVTEAEVKQIIDTALTDDQVKPFIRVANVLITNVLANEGYPASLLKEIELWLAAHYVAIRDPQVSKEKIGDVDAVYQGKTALGLEFTAHGQQVMTLDHHGKLAEISRSKGPAEVKTII